MSSKIYKLKKWLSLEDTAKRLSIEFGEEISIGDVLQLAIDQHLKISVDFPHDWHGKICDITEDEEKASTFEEVTGIENELVRIYEYEKCSETEYIKVLPEVYDFKAGIYEVKMIGNSKLDVEFLLKKELYSTATDVICLSGFYVVTKEGEIVERQSYFQHKPKIRDEFKSILFKTLTEKSILISEEQFNDVINSIEKRIDPKISNFYYPCPGIVEIEGANFVIQTKHLDEFLASLDDEPVSLNLDNSLYLLGEVINAVKSKNKKWTQSAIIDEILTQRQEKQISGLEQRKIEEYFSTANRLFKAK